MSLTEAHAPINPSPLWGGDVAPKLCGTQSVPVGVTGVGAKE